MQLLVFSDTHLSHHFDQAQYRLLAKIITSADRVIINGDWWDQYLTTFEAFIHSPWQTLFPLLKQRRAVYLPGNHDARDQLDDRWRLFACRIEDRISLTVGGCTYRIEHGHLRGHPFELRHPRLTRALQGGYPLLDWAEQQSYRLTHFYLNSLRERFAANDVDLLLYAAAHPFPNGWYIFGHSHIPKLDESAHYINTGMFRCGVATWLTMSDQHGHRLETTRY